MWECIITINYEKSFVKGLRIMIAARLRRITEKHANIINRVPLVNKYKIRGKKNKLILNKTMLKCRIIIRGTGNEIIINRGGGMRASSIYIDGNDNRITIDEDSSIINGNLYMEGNKNEITIGKNTKICGSTELACIESTSIRIEEDCLFSANVVFRTGDSHTIYDMERRRINASKSIHIGKHVWIGNDVKILKGVSIAPESIIGTGAVVTKSFDEKYVALGGNPAKVIKREVSWGTERV